MLGIIMITVGYMDKKVKKVEKEKEIEYRFVPRSIYDEQIKPVNLSDTFSTMFSDIDPIFIDK
tara:strand:- start:203 stop:391 length:189 start_codon:yes stop_codon:yes gene_type:complete